MATITLKNIPTGLHEKLRKRALRQRRSLNSEVIACLDQVLGSQPVEPKTLLSRARFLRHQVSMRLTDKSLSLLKNQGRP